VKGANLFKPVSAASLRPPQIADIGIVLNDPVAVAHFDGVGGILEGAA
jgi:hypothetical protein